MEFRRVLFRSYPEASCPDRASPAPAAAHAATAGRPVPGGRPARNGATMTIPHNGGTGPGRLGVRRWAGRLRRMPPSAKIALGAAAVLLALAAGISAAVSAPGHAARALPLAKNFTLPALGHPGQSVSLAQFADRPVIVNFFASWCVPCRKETPLLARFFRARHGNVAVIGIDVNDQTSAALAFVRKTGVTYPVATEPASGSTVVAYDLPGLPATFFLDARHHIVKRVYGAV